MKMTDELVDYVAALSRLEISGGQKEKLAADMGEIVAYMDVLNELDTAGVEPMSHVFPVTNVWREDEGIPSYDRTALLKNAPRRDDECFVVPQTVE